MSSGHRSVAPGWYPYDEQHEREWDGKRWIGEPRPRPGSDLAEQNRSAAPSEPQVRADLAGAMARMAVKIGGRRELRKIEEHISPDEQISEITTGYYAGGTGLIVLTDRRLLFFKEGWIGKTSEDFPVEKVSSIQFSSGLMLGKIVVFASGNRAEIENVNKSDGKRIVDNMRIRLSAPTPSTASVTPSPKEDDDLIATLHRLGELRDAGVITPEEFESKKRELLARL